MIDPHAPKHHHAGVPAGPGGHAGSYQPSDLEVAALIVAAAKHPLGTDFLVGGHLDTVAIMFRTHAYTVVAARERLRG
jgi:hypothetical protein